MTLPSHLAYHGTRPDWSAKDSALNNFGNRMSFAYLGKHWCSDIAFHIEDEDLVIPAHSLIVAAASPVLERCCFGFGNCVLPGKVIPVPNCSSTSFWVLLHHLYGSVGNYHRKKPDAPANIGLTIDNAAEVLRLADYYDLRQLRDTCKKLLLAEMNVDNVCAIYNQVRLLEDQVVAERCMLKMVFNVTELIDTAMEMDEPAIAELFRAADLRLCDETKLFDAIFDWAKAKCGDDSNPARRRAVMQNILQYVRFGCMSKDDFIQCLKRVEAGFFRSHEIGRILRQIAKPERYAIACPFVDMDKSTRKRTKKYARDGDTKDIPLLGPLAPYWCTPRAQNEYSEVSHIIAHKQEEQCWIDKYVMTLSFKLCAFDRHHEIALSGLTIPNFEGEIHIQPSKKKCRKLNTTVENDIVRFHPAVPQDGDNFWNLIIMVLRSAGRDCYEVYPTYLNNRTMGISNAEKIYTMVSAVHLLKSKRF